MPGSAGVPQSEVSAQNEVSLGKDGIWWGGGRQCKIKHWLSGHWYSWQAFRRRHLILLKTESLGNKSALITGGLRLLHYFIYITKISK